MNPQPDQDLWAAVVAADQLVARVRAEFYQHAKARREVLANALRGSNWERGAALSFLDVLPDDVPDLLDQLVDNAMSHRWALAARRAIAAGRREVVTPLIKRIVDERSVDADADDYRRLAELLRHLGDSDTLADLLRKAQHRGDPEFLEIVEDFSPDVANEKT